jgi:hypothetical protein
MASTWQSTSLWHELKHRDNVAAEAVRSTLGKWMPSIETVLRSGGTAPQDFTLHDAEHSFRVAERMRDIIPTDVLPHLSEYELGLLLFAAYLHDIGMTPARRKVQEHREYLLTGDPQNLSVVDRHRFQSWLDEHSGGVEPPIGLNSKLSESLKQADVIVTYYSRARHNDWSEEWIRDQMAAEKMGHYSSWLEDLVALCRSHHEGYDVLASKRFDPYSVGSPSDIVHLRYLAVVLRVADVLDVDPERTPDVLLNHREVAADSLVYWYKDQQLSIVLLGTQMVLSSRPKKAYIHRAVLDTANQIENELVLCRRLADSTHFEKRRGPGPDLPHRWDIEPFVFKDVRPLENTYEYIDGAFRPDVSRILEILSGVELYGTPLAAVRELLQNAFDAVREMIAFQRLEQPNPSDCVLASTLGNLHSVRLWVEMDSENRSWLICSDTGVGMTKEIITNHFLVSGSPQRHQILELERECASAGFHLGRTGHFGIGALSYFMIADKLILRTRRAQEAGNAEITGWEFESNGVDSFGELRRHGGVQRGTEVRLRLKGVLDAGIWLRSFVDYILKILIRVPCKLLVLDGTDSILTLEPGWVLDELRLDHLYVEELRKEHQIEADAFLTREEHERRVSESEVYEQFIKACGECLRWRSTTQELPHGWGECRIHTPYFDVLNEISLTYFKASPAPNGIYLDVLPRGSLSMRLMHEPRISWKGFAVSTLEERSVVEHDLRFSIIELDLVSASIATLAASRNNLTIPADKRVELSKVIQAAIVRSVQGLVSSNRESRFSLLNVVLAETRDEAVLPQDMSLYWVHPLPKNQSVESARIWAELTPPILHGSAHEFTAEPWWEGKPTTFTSELQFSLSMNSYQTVGWRYLIVPNRIVCVPEDLLAPSAIHSLPLRPLWTELTYPTPSRRYGTLFPECWRMVVGVAARYHREDYTVLNQENPLVRLSYQHIEPQSWRSNAYHPLQNPTEFEQDPTLLAAWIVAAFRGHQGISKVRVLCEKAPDFLAALFEALPGTDSNKPDQFLFVEGRFPQNRLWALSPNRLEELNYIDLYQFGIPQSEWMLSRSPLSNG